LWFALDLTYNFTSDFQPKIWYSDYAIRLNLWLSYAASIGATTNVANIGSRSSQNDGYGYTGVIFGAQNGDITKAFNTFQLPLSMRHNYVKVVYRTLSDYGYFHSLYIGDVLEQNCSNTRLKPPCVFEKTYTPGQVLKIEGRVWRNGGLFLGENLQIFFTNPIGRLDEPQSTERNMYEAQARQMYVLQEPVTGEFGTISPFGRILRNMAQR